MNYELMDEAVAFLQGHWPDAKPSHGLILGSGWSEVAGAFQLRDMIPYEDIPGLGRAGVVGHAGQLAWASLAGLETLLFQGRRHYYEGAGWTPVALPLYVLKQWGVGTVVLTNAAGGVREGFKPGDLMIIADHINHFNDHPLIGEHHPAWGPRFPDQSRVYDPALTALMAQAAQRTGIPIAQGVYLASSGPTYETPAEIRTFRSWGADAVGMSTVPEAMLASAAGLRVAGVSCITNLAAGIHPETLTHEEVTETTREAMPRMKKLLTAFWEGMPHAV